ncbi:MAG TPA: lactonase family protein [Chitinophagaceae bacterium]|nr:lactonase family protein [Chitinophagaceae bacterium]
MILYAGSYTEIIEEDLGGHGEGIYCFHFDPVSGSLALQAVQAALSPTYLCLPTRNYLYTHGEVTLAEKPVMQAYEIDPRDFSLRLIGEQPVPGGFPCHLSYSKSGACIFEACYETGNVVIYPVLPDGKLLPAAKSIQHAGSSIHPLRQEGPHAHAVLVDDDRHQILVTDLGLDQVLVYRVERRKGEFMADLLQTVSLSSGSGPRHMVLHPEGKYVFVLSELNAAVTVLRYVDGRLEALSACPTVALTAGMDASGAAVRISRDGKYVYASDRGSGKISVMRFNREKETLDLIQQADTLGRTPRDFILDPSGHWMLVANQDSDTIAVFKIDRDRGTISPDHMARNIASPACLAWLPRQ